jgi:TolB-like protein
MRPAVAVLPLANLSGDSEQEYFTDGLTEDLIAALSGWHALPVIARGSTFAFRKRQVDVRAIGRKLGALYVLEGTVRRDDRRVRIGVQLIEAESGENIFARHYDRKIADLGAVHDDIATHIVGQITPELLRHERERIARSPQLNLDAYECYQRGLWHHYHYAREHAEQAERHFRRSLQINGAYAPPAAALSIGILFSVMNGWAGPDRYEEALQLAGRAVALDPRDPQAHFALGSVNYHAGHVATALKNMEEAIGLNSSHAAAYATLGFLYNYLDQPGKALRCVLNAFRLSPADIRQFMWYTALAGAYYLKGQYEDAIEAGNRGLAIRPDYLHTARYIAASLGQLGRTAEARRYLDMVRTIDGDLSRTEAVLGRVFKPSALARVIEGLRRAESD